MASFPVGALKLAAEQRATLAPLLVVTGPTGTGKTSACIELGRRLGAATTDIVNADSVSMVAEVQIGAAKPTLAERQSIRHHLFDCVSLSEERPHNAVEFSRRAHALCAELVRAGHTPVVVGGTLHYLKWFLSWPVTALAPTFPSVEARDRFQQAVEQAGWDASMARLARLDPDAGASLPRHSWSKLAAAIYAVEQSGLPYASFGQPRELPLYDYRVVGMYWSNRLAFLHRLDARCEQMVRAGLLDEVLRLVADDKLRLPVDNGQQRAEQRQKAIVEYAIGYRQALRFVADCDKLAGRLAGGSSNPLWPLEAGQLFRQFVEEFRCATRELSRIQTTTLKKPGIVAVDVAAMGPRDAAELLHAVYTAPPQQFLRLQEQHVMPPPSAADLMKLREFRSRPSPLDEPAAAACYVDQVARFLSDHRAKRK